MYMISSENRLSASIVEAAKRAGNAIPPAWPLATSVAVNPFLGQSDEHLTTTAARLARVGGIPVTMPREWYKEKYNSGALADEDITDALSNCTMNLTLEAVLEALSSSSTLPTPLPNVSQLSRDISQTDWPTFIAERTGHWAAGYFDQGQALWQAPQKYGIWASWRRYARHDLTPEIMGLDGFARLVDEAPDNSTEVIRHAVDELELSTGALDSYFHALLISLGGWAHVGRYRQWQADLDERTDQSLLDLLALRLTWEVVLFRKYKDDISANWQAAVADHAKPIVPSRDIVIDCILQEALERAGQRTLAGRLQGRAAESKPATRPSLQAVFCIDVRSEIYRRTLEAADPGIETLGFAGFFGLGLEHQDFASDIAERRLPVLLNPSLNTRSGGEKDQAADQFTRYRARAIRAWGRFKQAAVSSFAFVEAAGPLYLGKLFRQAMCLSPASSQTKPMPHLKDTLSVEAKCEAAESILRAMTLTDNFARLVVLAGHGASVVNNPHASALHCGACGGYAGDVNARLLAQLLNDPDVRRDVRKRGIDIPADTLFVGALHDTTRDAITLFSDDVDTSQHGADLADADKWFRNASTHTRIERMSRLPNASGAADIFRRSRNWAEVRPEWALAGCHAFVAAPRRMTSQTALDGRAFLHNYEPEGDPESSILELIMTAPVVVASWISLQYYGSAVAPDTFGGGNKLLHNVVGGMGVIEGASGPLRAGLPWQSVHNGEQLAHEPVRLSVYIHAPIDEMNRILDKHESVRHLFDNGWLYLFRLDENGQVSARYSGNLQWIHQDRSGSQDHVLRAVS